MRSPTKVTACLDVTPIAGIVSSLVGAYAQNKAVEKQNEANLKLANLNNYWQNKWAKENNELAVKMMREQNQFNRNSALEMFNLENEYNTPANQAKRMLEAGLNPAVALQNGAVNQGNSNAAAPSAGGTPSLSMPNFVTPTMQAQPSVLLGAVQGIAELANARKLFSESKMTDKQIARYDEKIDAEINKLWTSSHLDEMNANYQELLNNVERYNLPKRKAAELQGLIQDVQYKLAQTKFTQAETAYRQVETYLADTNLKILKEQRPFLLQQLQENINLAKEKQQTEKSYQDSNRASAHASEVSASYYDALKRTEDDLREGKHKELQEAIEDRRYNRAISLLESYMRQHGYNTPVWNLTGNFADAMSRMFRNTFNMSEPVINFMDWFEKHVSHPSDDYRNTDW